MFGIILISVITLIQIYVFWRATSVPFIARHISNCTLIGVGLLLWTVFFLGRVYGHHGTGIPAATLEFLGMTWMAVLFLTFIPLLSIDLVTLFGFLVPRLLPSLRGWALSVGIMLSVIALFQGLRPPVVENYEVSLSGLPDDLDGTVLVVLTDMHLGSQLGERWLAARIAQVKALQPDFVVLVGDIFEGHGTGEDQLTAAFRQLSAPLGIWAVLGNHEYYGRDRKHLFEEAGIKLLRNEWAEVTPGLVLAGVDDFTGRRRRGQGGDPILQALSGRPHGTTILLSHIPEQIEKAAKADVGLMISGHTHGGQIWPFDYLVKNRYPLLEGLYRVDGMSVIVSRGTGTWGPRMRLWRPGVIVRVTLRVNGKRT